jgi:fatty acid desaturase
MQATAVEGSFLFTNFALSHTTMPYIEHHMREHWVERSVRRTIDIHSHSRFVGPFFGKIIDKSVDWFMGYLNYQVAHHLWPKMPQVNQSNPIVHDAIRKLCSENPGLQMH